MLKHVESLVDCQISSTPCCESLTPSPAIACVHQCMLWCHKKIFPGQSSTSPRDKAPRYARCWENVGRLRRLMGDFVTPRTPHRVFKAQHAQHALNSVISSLSNLCPILSNRFWLYLLRFPVLWPSTLSTRCGGSSSSLFENLLVADRPSPQKSTETDRLRSINQLHLSMT